MRKTEKRGERGGERDREIERECEERGERTKSDEARHSDAGSVPASFLYQLKCMGLTF